METVALGASNASWDREEPAQEIYLPSGYRAL